METGLKDAAHENYESAHDYLICTPSLALNLYKKYQIVYASVQWIECFHSRGQHLCKFIGTKKSVCIRKEFNSHRIGLGHQHGRRFIVLGHQYGRCDVMWKHSIGLLLTVTDVVKLTLKMTAAQVVETSVISELTQRDGRGKKTANLVWQAWQ